MYTKRILVLSISLFLPLYCKAAGTTELFVISALHGAHKDHPTYDYQTLYSLVDSFEPDYVGVEIRQEDIKAKKQYLQKNYPKEMVELANRYKSKAFGFDWLGEGIEGVEIPDNYWADLEVKKLAKEMSQDNYFLSKEPKELGVQRELQSKIIEQATPYSLNNGEYGKICREIDKLEEVWFSGSKYAEIIDFNKKRDERIGDSIIKFIEQHKGKRIVLVMGADHRTFAVEHIKEYFESDVQILPIGKPAD